MYHILAGCQTNSLSYVYTLYNIWRKSVCFFLTVDVVVVRVDVTENTLVAEVKLRLKCRHTYFFVSNIMYAYFVVMPNSISSICKKVLRLKAFQQKFSLEIPNNTINNISLPTSQDRVPGSVWRLVALPWPFWRRWRRWPRVRPWPSPGDSPLHRTDRCGHRRP